MPIQVLSCNSVLGSCCSSNILVVLLSVAKRVFQMIQIIVPILLILGSTIHLVKRVNNPDMKNGTKNFINMYIAAIIVFFLPVIVDAALGLLPNSFSVTACWKKAKTMDETLHVSSSSYQNPYSEDNKKSSIYVKPDDYEKGEKKASVSGFDFLGLFNNNSNNTSNNNSSKTYTSTGAGNGSAKGKEIVNYALSFVGKSYAYGGSWNGELPYTSTDCSGFVQGVFKHFGIRLTRSTYSQWNDKSSYSLVRDGEEIKAGDLVMYNGHVAILTGNGREIVHAKGRKWGIVVDKDYRSSSSKSILGIMRINGVN